MAKKNEGLLEALKKTRNILALNTNMPKPKRGHYEEDLTAKTDDRLDDDVIRKIFLAGDVRENFMNAVFEAHKEEILGKHEVLLKIIEQYMPRGLFADYRGQIQTYLTTHVHFIPPYDHYKNQKVLMNLIMDTGDGCQNFKANSKAYPHITGLVANEIPDEASILWLAWSQGYGYHTLRKSLVTGDEMGSGFLESLREELVFMENGELAVAFFSFMTLEKSIDLWYSFHKKKSIRVPKDSRCGLVTPWNLGNSSLFIELEKDVIVEPGMIYSIVPDESMGNANGVKYSFPTDYWGNAEFEAV